MLAAELAGASSHLRRVEVRRAPGRRPPLAGLQPRRSAGLLVFCRYYGGLEVLLTHPGGPYFATKDQGVWSAPQALLGPEEGAFGAAQRQFERALGVTLPPGPRFDLGGVTLKSRTRLQIFAVEVSPGALVRAGTAASYELEWPPGSGQRRRYPEVDRAGWFDLEAARQKLTQAQHPFLQRLTAALG